MRKIQLVGLLLVTVGAFSAFFVASASAVLTWEAALWLNNGVDSPNGTVLPVTTTGGLLFHNVLNGAEFLCSVIFDGTIVNNAGSPQQGLLEVTKMLNTATAEIESLDEPGATGGIVCNEQLKVCTTGAEIWPGGLPWNFDLVQDSTEPTKFALELLTKASYSILCHSIVLVEELCEAILGTIGEILNVSGGIEPVGAGSLLSPCGANAEDGEIIADPGGLTALTTGGPLAASLNAAKE